MKIEELVPVEYAEQRVVTNKQLADFYGVTVERIKDNFRKSKKHFVLGVHYFKLSGEELRALKEELRERIMREDVSENFRHVCDTSTVKSVFSASNALILYTERGVAMHCKMLRKPDALEVFEELKRGYFETQEVSAAIVTISGLHCYIDDNQVAWLNVEDVARGLGFVEAKKFSANGENYIRWERINGYLAEYDYPPVKAGDFIPENIFYLLSMKANNDAAKKFQLHVANEILPSLRRTGSYSLSASTDRLQELEEKVAGLEILFTQWLEQMDKQLLPPVERAHELIALADRIKNDELRDKILCKAANFFLGKNLF